MAGPSFANLGSNLTLIMKRSSFWGLLHTKRLKYGPKMVFLWCQLALWFQNDRGELKNED